MTVMKAVRVTRTGGPRSLDVLEVAEPRPGPDEVLIEVAAAGVNFPDLLLSKDLYQVKPELPFTLGGEYAGIVREAPAGSGFAPGDRVAAFSTVGGFAELAVAPVAQTLPMPDDVGFAAAACVPMNYLTMWFGLTTRGGLRAGETVLVHGAAGGIGTATIQLAGALGARTIAVVSTQEKAEFVRSVGADVVVLAEGFRNAVAELGGVDMVVDPVGGDRFTDSLRCLNPLGRLLVLGFTAGDIPTVKVNRLLLGNIDVRGVGWGAFARDRDGFLRECWDAVVPLLADGRVDPPIAGVFPLDAAGDAVALLEERTVLGKAVIEVRS